MRNADTLAITDAEVRVYWADPTGGLPHTEWALIGTAAVSVPAGAGNEAVAGPIMWTPGPAEPEHCCLFAIVNTGDDYHSAATLDPIVWGFDITRDNNIIWKNMWIVEVAPAPPPPGGGKGGAGAGGGTAELGRGKKLTFVARNPFPTPLTLDVSVRVRPISAEDVLRLGFSAQALRRAGGPELKELGPGTPGEATRPLAPKAEPKAGKLIPAGFLTPKARSRLRLDFKPEGGWRNLGGKPHDAGLVFSLGLVEPGKGGRLNVDVAAALGAEPGEIHRIDFEQRTGGQVTGGGTYVVVVRA